jgi:methionyl-tRNA synthetase
MKYITTAIDYPNALPHIGTAFEKVGADVFARFQKFKGEELTFLMGNDENTSKVIKKANELGKNVQDYTKNMAKDFQKTWKSLSISYTDFVRTSEKDHATGVTEFIKAIFEAGFIEKRSYKAPYCFGCEEYKTSISAPDRICPNHPDQKLEEIEEENYFFLISKLREELLELYKSKKFAIEPVYKYNEILTSVEGNLPDISISRKNIGWGIPIPWDNSQVIHVWFDALLSYLTGVGFGTNPNKFQRIWPAEVHFIGKDITKFHCILFPAMIMAYNKVRSPIALPKKVFSHGFIYQEDRKLSKSHLSVSPQDLVNEFGVDGFRYFFLSRQNFWSDGEYSYETMKQIYNSYLSNALGNLVSRVAGMANQYFDGKIPGFEGDLEQKNFWIDKPALRRYQSCIEKFEYSSCLKLIWDIVGECNQYIEETKPWDMHVVNPETCAYILRSLVAGIRIISLLLYPFLPKTAKTIYASFRFSNEEVNWEYLQVLAKNNMYKLNEGIRINSDFLDENGKYKTLFPRKK